MNGYTHKDYSLIFGRGAEWFYKMEIKLIREIDKGNLYPWAFAEMADRAYGESNIPCKYNTFFSQLDVTLETQENCRKIGAPLGKVKYVRRLN